MHKRVEGQTNLSASQISKTFRSLRSVVYSHDSWIKMSQPKKKNYARTSESRKAAVALVDTLGLCTNESKITKSHHRKISTMITINSPVKNLLAKYFSRVKTVFFKKMCYNDQIVDKQNISKEQNLPEKNIDVVKSA